MHNGAALAVRPLPHKGDSQASSIVSARLVHERIALLPLRCVHRARSGQLQHRCVLAFAQLGEQHGLPVGELQRIVMHARPR